MAKYKLEMQEEDYKTSLEFNSDDLSDVVASMEHFLKGCGFIFDGALDIHDGEVQMNAMHYTYKTMYRDRDFDDVIKQDDDLDIGVNHD